MTTMTEIQTTQVYQVFIKATPERIWDAITKPEFVEKYFFGAQIESTYEPGTPIRSWSPDRSKLWGDNTVVEADPPRRLVHTWRSLFDDEQASEEESRVTWEIEPHDGGYSKLTLVHDQLEGAPKTAASVAGGWMLIISGLKTLVETGEPLTSDWG
jgi:uncharacterized protein YndB with AHSA1/START domain